MSYQVRPVGEAETSLVYSSYIKSLWQRGGGHGQFSYTEHCRVAHERMESLLASQPIALCVIDDEAPGWCGGWILGHALDDGDVAVHWVYVKHDFRRHGLAALMLRALRSACNTPDSRLALILRELRAQGGQRIIATHPHHRWREQSQRLGVVLQPLGKVLERRVGT